MGKSFYTLNFFIIALIQYASFELQMRINSGKKEVGPLSENFIHWNIVPICELLKIGELMNDKKN